MIYFVIFDHIGRIFDHFRWISTFLDLLIDFRFYSKRGKFDWKLEDMILHILLLKSSIVQPFSVTLSSWLGTPLSDAKHRIPKHVLRHTGQIVVLENREDELEIWHVFIFEQFLCQRILNVKFQYYYCNEWCTKCK